MSLQAELDALRIEFVRSVASAAWVEFWPYLNDKRAPPSCSGAFPER